VARTPFQKIQAFKAANEGEIDAAFVALTRERPGALFIAPDPFLVSRREQIVALANHYKFPALYHWREFAEVGGLASYGPSHTDLIAWSAFTPAAFSKVPTPAICLSSSPRGSSS
jgi:hypothetical protein